VHILDIGNVELLADVPLFELRRLYARAKFYLHTKRSECFGIVVVEAMSAACVPIVPKSGGPWCDIIERGKYGLGYSNEHEAAELIRSADGAGREAMAALARERSETFSYSQFKKQLLAITGDMQQRGQ
jgi:glycosyltransferase involved in cell wall biosynthesis